MSTDEPLKLSMLRKCAIVADRPDMSAKCYCCFVVAICDLVHDLEDTMHQCLWRSFLKYARETSFASLIFQKARTGPGLE